MEYTFSERELSAGPKKKVDVWAGIKKVWSVAKGPIMGLIKTAVGFIPGIGPILGKGLSLIAPDSQTAGGFADIIGAGKKMLKENVSFDLKAFIEKQAREKGIKLPPEQEKNIETAIKEPGPVNVTDENTVRNKILNKAKNITPETTEEKQGNKTVKKSSEGVVYSLFARQEPTNEENFKKERKEIQDSIKNMETNVDTVNKKLSKYFDVNNFFRPVVKNADVQIGQSYQIRLDNIWSRLVNLKKDIKTVTLQDEPFIKLDFKGALIVLQKYRDDLLKMYKDISGLNTEIDNFVTGKGVKTEKLVDTKIETKQRRAEDVRPPPPPWLWPVVIGVGAVSLAIVVPVVIPKIFKKKG